MPDGFLNIGHNFTGLTDYLIVDWVKSTAQGTPVVGHVTGTGLGGQNDTDATEVNYPAPHVEETLQITEISTVWHLVRFWRSSDGIAKDELLLTLAGNARTGALFPINRYEYVVGRGQSDPGVWADPVQDDTGIGDTRLQDKTYWIEERGTGSLLAAEIANRVAGGFDFVDVNKVMNDGGVYVAYVINQVDLPGEDSGGDSDGSDVFILSADDDYDPLTMGGRTIIADFATTVGTLNIPNLTLVADSRFILQTHSGMQRNVVIQLDAGDTIRFNGEDVNSIVLGQSEEIEILFKDNVAYVMNDNTGNKQLGKQEFAYRELLNTVIADGDLLALADYPRVAILLNKLPALSVVSEVTWQTTALQADGQTVAINKGKWMSDGVNFRPPDLRDKVIKGVDSAAVYGRYEHQTLMQHQHLWGGANDNGGTPYVSENHGAGGNSSYQLNGSSAAPTHYRTGDVYNVGSTDQKVNNTGLLPLICI